ncbi:helix-turn-helix transcriptional regulator [Photobacterium frigidiphilum]|uniref:Helix-turn-helix transcriptional regulator n=1 Tax=Photobacterium frigidiphilum TaxID=264736 RepID=A0A2T3J751_9GAMM|nr:LuxR C-terminal-related transcriptional regulator [Photobacterium frigidiphilum]PSU44572.1 helix-turn-helix transcriptional regulator [Photobacterium frigidiphilum]
MHKQKDNKFLFISCSSLQSSLFKEYLEKSLDISIECTTFDKLKKSELVKFNEVTIIIDHTKITDDSYDQYIDFVCTHSLITQEVFINSKDNIDIEELAKWPNIVGIFFETDELSTVVKGMRTIIDGELWLSRKVTQRLISAYRSKEPITPKHDAKLTTREKEIMKLLVSGVSNVQIAQKLYVSENTIKTHLHNVFKKIKVKNRIQAFMWAKNHYYNDISS